MSAHSADDKSRRRKLTPKERVLKKNAVGQAREYLKSDQGQPVQPAPAAPFTAFNPGKSGAGGRLRFEKED